MTTTPREPTLDEIIAFLLGEGELNGRWFGEEPPPAYRGMFWWRTELRAAWNRRAVPAAAGEGEAGQWTQAALDKVREEAAILRARGRAAPASRDEGVSDERLAELINGCASYCMKLKYGECTTLACLERDAYGRAVLPVKLLGCEALHTDSALRELQRLRTLSAEAAPKCEKESP
jgi:hypothetical protein